MIFRNKLSTFLLSFILFIPYIESKQLLLTVPETESKKYDFAEDMRNINNGRFRRQAGLETIVNAFHVNTNIRFRFASTQVISEMFNPSFSKSDETVFHLLLPSEAFISKFIITVNGKEYEAVVKEKLEAKLGYLKAKKQGLTTALVETNARDANEITVKFNLKQRESVKFTLTYQELLERKLGTYEYALYLNLNEKFLTDDFMISINIHETTNLTNLFVSNLRNDTEIYDQRGNSNAKTTRLSGNTAHIKWNPTMLEQRSWNNIGSVGKFIVQYDVERESDMGEILLMNGYFVHFFTSNKTSIPKHVIFVLDTSGSMGGVRIRQLKEVMSMILDELSEKDYFNIIQFSSNEKTWKERNSVNRAISATNSNILEAQNYVKSLNADGGTNINSALLKALNLSSLTKGCPSPYHCINNQIQPIIMFLTDGEPTEGETNLDKIRQNVKRENREKIPIYSLAFGEGADYEYLKTLSNENYGYGKKIFEGTDAALQTHKFFRQISSIVLKNLNFKYTTDIKKGEYKIEKTRTSFPTLTLGSELVIAGKIVAETKNNNNSSLLEKFDIPSNLLINCTLNFIGDKGRIIISDNSNNDLTFINLQNSYDLENDFLERLWAYLEIKYLLKINTTSDMESNEDESNEDTSEEVKLRRLRVGVIESNTNPKAKALQLALKYKLVTPITSLLIVKPDSTTEELNLVKSKHIAKVPERDYLPDHHLYNYGQIFRSYDESSKTRSNYDPNFPTSKEFSGLSYIPPPPQFLPPPRPIYNYPNSYQNNYPTIPGKQNIRPVVKIQDSDFLKYLIVQKQWPVQFEESLNESRAFIFKDAQKYMIVVEGFNINVPPNPQAQCVGGKRNRRISGVCKHIKDCTKINVQKDFNKYIGNYFCSISSGNSSFDYAGVCC